MTRRRVRIARSSAGSSPPGQAIVEFALASIMFLTIVFGTIDFGRAVFVSAELRHAAREGARFGKIHPTDTAGIKAVVIAQARGTGLTSSGVTVTCSGSCKTDDKVVVTVSVGFQAVTQDFLGISPLTLTSSSTSRIE